jgi:hypothetical protein
MGKDLSMKMKQLFFEILALVFEKHSKLSKNSRGCE